MLVSELHNPLILLVIAILFISYCARGTTAHPGGQDLSCMRFLAGFFLGFDLGFDFVFAFSTHCLPLCIFNPRVVLARPHHLKMLRQHLSKVRLLKLHDTRPILLF